MDESIDPIEAAEAFNARYEQLWTELTRDEVFHRDESYRIDQRVKRLNALGFDVAEIGITTEAGGQRLRFGTHVVEPGHHQRRIRALTGLIVQENEARALLSDLARFRARLQSASGVEIPEDLAARRWLDEKFYGVLSLLPMDQRRKLPDAELFYEINEHRWFLSEARGHDVGREAAVASYLDSVLRYLPESKVDLLVGTTDRGVRGDHRLGFVPWLSTRARSRSAARGTPGSCPGLTITKLAVGPMSNNAYLLRDPSTGEGLLIDAANEADRLAAARPARRASRGRRAHHPSAPGSLDGTRGGRRRCATPPSTPVGPMPTRCRSPSTSDWRTATRSPSAMCRCRSSACAATRPARSLSSTATPRAPRTCSPATRCSPAGSARRTTPEDFTSLLDDVDRAGLRRAAGRDLVLPRPRRRLDARRAAPAPGRVARARLVKQLDRAISIDSVGLLSPAIVALVVARGSPSAWARLRAISIDSVWLALARNRCSRGCQGVAQRLGSPSGDLDRCLSVVRPTDCGRTSAYIWRWWWVLTPERCATGDSAVSRIRRNRG